MAEPPSPPEAPGNAAARPWWRTLASRLPWARDDEGDPTVREAVAELIEESGEADAPIDAHERLLLSNILHLRDVTAEDVMMPRADIVAAPIDTALNELLRRMVDEGVSRMPVYRETLDDALGMIHIKDAVRHLVDEAPGPVARMLRPILYVAPSMRVLDLLLEMRVKRTHMALVIDEYGGVDGLVTIEDLVEQIVGEIEDEHDTDAEPEMTMTSDSVMEADARVPIGDFENRVGPVLSEEERQDTETLGGLVAFLAGHVPGRGELVPHESGIEFQVTDADPRRVKRLRIRNLPPRPAGGEGDGRP